MGQDVTLYPLDSAAWLAQAALPLERDRDFFAVLHDLEAFAGIERTCSRVDGEAITFQCVTVGDLLALEWPRTSMLSAAALAYLSCLPPQWRVGISWQ